MATWGWSIDQEDAFVRLQYHARKQSYLARYPNAYDSIILLDGEAIGRILIADSADEIRLVDIAILPRSQGMGIGSTVIGRLIDSVATSHKPIRLHVGVLNRARDLYERLGFQRVEENGGNYLMEFVPSSPTRCSND
jgi:ribosomal protein S18 acetylase RimI-like enzyme